jgi:hypothetical protein
MILYAIMEKKGIEILAEPSRASEWGLRRLAKGWLKASRALSKDDQIYGQRLAEMAKMHFSEAFYFMPFWDRGKQDRFKDTMDILKMMAIISEVLRSWIR